jgi:hypothetical protein
MTRILALVIVIFSALSAAAQDFKPTNEDYDISDGMIRSSVTRTKYFIKDSLLNIGINSEEFLKDADRSKPTVIYLHGCNNDKPGYHFSLMKFYLGLGFNFAFADFINRGDAKRSCVEVNGVLVVRTNYRKRLPARVLELNAHIDWLKENGFKTIYVVGFSEGGMVIQRMNKAVDAAIIHSMSCLPLPPDAKTPTNQHKYLQLISRNDPFLATQGAVSCEGQPGFETFSFAVGNAPTHDPFSDPSWAGRIKQFLGVDK